MSRERVVPSGKVTWADLIPSASPIRKGVPAWIVSWLATSVAGLSHSTTLAMKMGNEMRNGQVLCSASNAVQTILWPEISPARTSGVCGESTMAAAQGGVTTEYDSAMATLSKLTNRSKG